MEVSGSGEEIAPGPRKEGETRTAKVALTKSQDHLNCQVSLDDDTNHDTQVLYHLFLVN